MTTGALEHEHVNGGTSLPGGPKKIDATRNSLIGLVYNILSLSARLALFAALPRLIPYGPLGRYFYVIAIVAILTKFLDWGTAGMVKRFAIPMYHNSPERILSFILRLGVHKLFLVGLVAIAVGFLPQLGESNWERWAMVGAAGALTYAGLGGRILYASDQVSTLRGLELSYQILQPVLVVVFFFLLGMDGVPTAVLVSTLALLGLNTLASRRYMPQSDGKRYRFSNEEIKFGLVVYFGNMVFTEFPSITVAVINWIYPDQVALQAITGIAVALALRTLVQFCTFIPASTENYVMQIGTLGVPDELARALREQWRQMNLFAIGLISVVYVSADSAIPILLGAKYTDATTHVVAFLPAALFLSWLYLFRNYIFVVHNYAVYVAAPIASMALYVALMFALLRKPEDAPIAGLLTAVALFVAVVFFSVALRHLASPAVLIRILAQVAWPSALAVLAVVPVRFVVEFLPFASYVAIVVYPTVAVAVFTISATAAGLLPRSTIRDLINRLKRGT